jgi:CoA:oxalate CoA-transferase
MTEELPLSGVHVVDLSELLPGPYATLVLSQLGARVTKIERPEGDPARTISPGMFLALNSTKRIMAVDLKNPAGLATVLDLVSTADVFVEGFRPGVIGRLGLDGAKLLELNPRLIYVSVSGFGQEGSKRSHPGHDVNYAALTGLAAISGAEPDVPRYEVGVPVGDLAASTFVLTSVLGGLIERDRTGKGRYYDIAITDSISHFMTARIGDRLVNGREASAIDFKRSLVQRPGYGLFRARDGRYLALGVVESPFWLRLVKAIGIPALLRPEFEDYTARASCADEINRLLSDAFSTADRDTWVSLLQAHDVPCDPVLDIDESLRSDQLYRRGLVSKGGAYPIIRLPGRQESADAVREDP